MAWTKRTASDFKDCLSQINDFATKAWGAGSVTAGTNTGDGIVYGASASENSVAETWTLTCTTGGGDGTAVFSVSGSVSGAQSSSTSGDPYSIDEVSFIILAGDTDWSVSDSFTFNTAAIAAEWSTEESDLVSSQQYIILNGIGGGSDEIFAGFRTQSDDSTYFNIEISGFSGYVSGNAYDAQPGFSSYYACMSSVSFEFYLIMTARHIKIIPIIGTIYGAGYTGWFLPTATASQYSYPQYIGGSTDDASQLVGGTEDDHTCYWRGYSAEYSGAVNDGSQWREINKFIPSSYGVFENWFADLDGNRRLYPAVILDETQSELYGTIEGVYYVPNGDSALTAEDVINDGSKGYICFQDTFRTGTLNVAAFDLMGDT